MKLSPKLECKCPEGFIKLSEEYFCYEEVLVEVEARKDKITRFIYLGVILAMILIIFIFIYIIIKTKKKLNSIKKLNDV
jgi:uncharacterized membrane protein YukC